MRHQPLRATLSTLCFLAFLFTSVHASDRLPVLDLDAHRGKVVVVDFWASWCEPCRRSFPWMNEMQEKYGHEGLLFIGINEDASWEEASRFLEKYPAGFEIIRDDDGLLARQFDVIAMPSSYVFDRKGRLVNRHMGFRTRLTNEYETLIRDLLSRTVGRSDVSGE